MAQIIDVDTVPERCRRVRLLKHGSDRPLGFYIRDGTSLRVTPTGLEKVRHLLFVFVTVSASPNSTGLGNVRHHMLSHYSSSDRQNLTF